MKINAASKLTAGDVYEAALKARNLGQDIFVEELREGGRGAIEFWCASEHGRHNTGRSNSNGMKAASWCAWGWLIAELYRRDPDAHIGWYKDSSDFVNKVQDDRELYLLRRNIGASERPGERGSDISFLVGVGG